MSSEPLPKLSKSVLLSEFEYSGQGWIVRDEQLRSKHYVCLESVKIREQEIVQKVNEVLRVVESGNRNKAQDLLCALLEDLEDRE